MQGCVVHTGMHAWQAKKKFFLCVLVHVCLCALVHARVHLLLGAGTYVRV